MSSTLRFAIVFLIFFCDAAFSQEYFGKYHGTVEVSWGKDPRRMTLLSDFEFEDPNGLKWIAKKSYETDGASIPESLWSLVGSPFTGLYRDAAVIHDAACQEKSRTWEVVHLAFYYAMRASGVPAVRAKMMYAAVYHFGPRWPMQRQIVNVPAVVRTEVIPPVFRTVSEQVIVKPSSKEWTETPERRQVVLDSRRDPATGRTAVLVEVPAIYQTVTRQILVQGESTRVVTIPATYSTYLELPPDKFVTVEDLSTLLRKISENEDTAKSVSLEEIRNFQR